MFHMFPASLGAFDTFTNAISLLVHMRLYATCPCNDNALEMVHRHDLLEYMHHCMKRDLRLTSRAYLRRSLSGL